MAEGGGPCTDGVSRGFAGGGGHMENRRPDTKSEWQLPGDRPGGGSMEDSDGDFESPYWDGYRFTPRPKRLLKWKGNGDCLPRGQAAPTAGDHEGEGPI